MFPLLRLIWPSAHDRRDERAAIRLRRDLGRLGRLVSWSRRGDGRWLARLSGRDFSGTVERSGQTRCEAIRRADAYLAALLDDES